jgi:hypothetical protein
MKIIEVTTTIVNTNGGKAVMQEMMKMMLGSLITALLRAQRKSQ